MLGFLTHNTNFISKKKGAKYHFLVQGVPLFANKAYFEFHIEGAFFAEIAKYEFDVKGTL